MPLLSVEPVPTILFQNALELYGTRSDKDYSLTDCISMLICRRLGIREIAMVPPKSVALTDVTLA